MSLILAILRFLRGVFPIPLLLLALVAILGAVLLVYLAIRLLISIKMVNTRTKALYSCVVVYIIMSICKLLPYMSPVYKTVPLEFVAAMNTDAPENGMILTYYSVERGPFTLNSSYKEIKSQSFLANELEWVQQYIQDTDQYTYIISYGQELDRVSYSIWDSYADLLPVPWNGGDIIPTYSVLREKLNMIYIYRIESVPIDSLR